MADRVPLVVDIVDKKIKELPTGDSLDMTGSGISNLENLGITGNANIGGTLEVNEGGTFLGSTTFTTISAESLTINGQTPITSLVQSDWDETNPSSAAFILNKPDLGTSRIQDATDLRGLAGAANGDSVILVREGENVFFEFQTIGTGGGIQLTDLGAQKLTASGTGSFTYNNSTGLFQVAFPEIVGGTDINVAVNGTGQIEITFTGDTGGGGLIDLSAYTIGNLGDVNTTTVPPAVGQVLKWDGSVWKPANDDSGTGGITSESDTLDSVVTRGSTTNASITTGGLDAQTGTIQTTGSIIGGTLDSTGDTTVAGNLTVETDTFLTNLAANSILHLTATSGVNATAGFTMSSGGDVAMPGNLAVVGNITAGTVTATTIDSGGTGTPQVESTTDLNLVAADRIDLFASMLGLPTKSANPTVPTPQVGDMIFNDTAGTIAVYSNNYDGAGGFGWMYVPAANAPFPTILPNLTNTQRNAITPAFGMLIANTDTQTIQAYNGSSWVNL